MDYKIIDNIVEVPKSGTGTIFSVMISKENITNVTVVCDYCVKFNTTEVTIKARKDHDIVEERTFPNTNIFPKHIVRTRTHIIIYLESFGL